MIVAWLLMLGSKLPCAHAGMRAGANSEQRKY